MVLPGLKKFTEFQKKTIVTAKAKYLKFNKSYLYDISKKKIFTYTNVRNSGLARL